MNEPLSNPFFTAPMEYDRTLGWNVVAAPGAVYEADGRWFLTSHEAVRFGQTHPEIFSSARAFDGLGSRVPLIPIAIDPPDHARYRRVLDPMMSPKVLDQMEGSLRSQIIDLIDSFIGTGECDVVSQIAVPYPTQALLTLFGLPLEDRDQLVDWMRVIFSHPDPQGEPVPAVALAAEELLAYLDLTISRKRHQSGSDMLSRILALTDGDEWSNQEVVGLCYLFVLAGLDTVTAAIGFTMYHLAQRPDLRALIVSDPDSVMPIIEAILRIETPAFSVPRITTQDVEVCGVKIPQGAAVNLVIATANRDPLEVAHPSEIDLSINRSHLSFGGGIHRCVGSHLARRELRLVVEEFHRRIPDYSIAGDVVPKVEWPSSGLHLESLPLSFRAVPTR